MLVFWLAGLWELVGKMTFLVIVVTGGPAQVLIFSMCCLVAATLILSQGLGCVNPSSQGRALRRGATGAVIATISIMPIFLLVPARSLGLGRLRAMRRYGLCLLKAERKRASVPSVILGSFRGRAVAPGAASIYHTDQQRKVQGGFGLRRDSLHNGLVPNVFLTTFLFVLARMKGLRPSWNRRIKTGSEITASTSNSRRTVCGCSR